MNFIARKVSRRSKFNYKYNSLLPIVSFFYINYASLLLTSFRGERSLELFIVRFKGPCPWQINKFHLRTLSFYFSEWRIWDGSSSVKGTGEEKTSVAMSVKSSANVICYYFKIYVGISVQPITTENLNLRRNGVQHKRS